MESYGSNSPEDSVEATSTCHSCTHSDSVNEHQCHLRTADIVKGVHAELREKYKQCDGNFSQIWEAHCRDKEKLTEYATAMHHLAVDHWTKNNETRIDWCRNICLEYFLHGGLEKVLEKDERRRNFNADKKFGSWAQGLETEAISDNSCSDSAASCALEGATDKEESENVIMSCLNGGQGETSICDNAESLPETFRKAVDLREDAVLSETGADGGSSYDTSFEIIEESESSNTAAVTSSAAYPCHSRVGQPEYNIVLPPFKGKIRLLDVGSCYNPFTVFQEFLAFGIDISPAVETVFHCDFLQLEVLEPLQVAADTMDTLLSHLKGPIEKLSGECFHVVIFSLLLEYFPSPYQRWLCCEKAHSLLSVNGLLIIITPDSHGQHKNAPMMKSWKRAIESMGFTRWRYVKLEHLHCMAYRKMYKPVKNNLLMDDIGPDLLYIPQDFHEIAEKDPFRTPSVISEEEELLRADSLAELPSWDVL